MNTIQSIKNKYTPDHSIKVGATIFNNNLYRLVEYQNAIRVYKRSVLMFEMNKKDFFDQFIDNKRVNLLLINEYAKHN